MVVILANTTKLKLKCMHGTVNNDTIDPLWGYVRFLLLISCCHLLELNSTKFIRTFMGQFLKSDNIDRIIENRNDRYYAREQISNAYNFYFRATFNYIYK